jgi:hypothetical protein
MTAKTYYEKLQDPRWQRKRLDVMQRAGFACEWCGSRAAALNIHHGWYAKGCEPWDYGEVTLYCLCQPCHERAETLKRELYFEIARIHPREHEQLLQAMREWAREMLEAKLREKMQEPPPPVIVVGVSEGQVTEDGKGEQTFPSIEQAREVFPDLDPAKNTERFTQAMQTTVEGRVVGLRFETWKAYQLYSG